ncbi:hypothetical protein U1Q18_036258 [Sarracenia purpurea var. burkii]
MTTEVPVSALEEVDLEVENNLGADNDSRIGNYGNGGADKKLPFSSVSVVKTVRMPTSGLDEDDGTIFEEGESVVEPRTNAVSEEAKVLNQTTCSHHKIVEGHEVKPRVVSPEKDKGENKAMVAQLKNQDGWIKVGKRKSHCATQKSAKNVAEPASKSRRSFSPIKSAALPRLADALHDRARDSAEFQTPVYDHCDTLLRRSSPSSQASMFLQDVEGNGKMGLCSKG